MFSVFWLVISSGGAYYNNSAAVNIVLLLSVALILVQLFVFRADLMARSGRAVIYMAALFLLMICSMLANSDTASFLTYARLLVVVVLAMCTVRLVGVARFLSLCVFSVAFLSLVSLVLYYSEALVSFSSLFPSFSSNEISYRNAFLYSEIEGVERRNSGVFIEPGLFQVYLNFCLGLLLLGVVRARGANVLILVFLASIFSTSSTTGFIVATAFLVLSIWGPSGRLSGGGAVKYLILLAALVFVGSSDYVTSNVADKFTNDVNMSFLTRLNSTVIDLIAISENPYFGIGAGEYLNFVSYYDGRGLVVDAATNTFTQLSAYVGLVFSLAVVVRGGAFFFGIVKSRSARVAFLVWYVLSFATEPFVLFPFFYTFSFLSFATNE